MDDSVTYDTPKRAIRRKDLAFLQGELTFWQNANLISERQVDAIGGLYEPAKGHLSNVLVGLGAMLVGLGFLSWIAANWLEFGRLFRVALILGVYILAVLSAWRLEPSFPRTSRALLLLGSFVYGGGIFLVAQMFHEGGHYTDALFWWMAGVVPAALIFKDRLQLILLQVIAVVYLNGLYQPWYTLFDRYGYDRYAPSLASYLWNVLRRPEPLLVVLALWAICRFIDKRWSFGFRMNTFLTLNLLVIHAFRFFGDFALAMVFCVLVGILLGACAFGHWKWDLGGWGIVLMGAAGLFLTLPDVWRHSRIFREGLFPRAEALTAAVAASPEVAFSVGMAIFLCVAMLWFIYRGFTIAIPMFCLLILRYYFDRFYDFMPKALFFGIGGFMLIGMGFWLERARKKNRRPKTRPGGEGQS